MQKQLAAYSNDTSDEARAKTQQIRLQLEEEESNLESDQFDRYLEEQKLILTSIQEDYEKALDSYLDDTAKVISDSINKVNNSTTAINGTIKSECDDVGYEISDEMRTVWEDEKKVLSNEFDGVEKNIEANNGVLSGFTESTSEIFISMGLDIKSIDGTLISIANKMDSLSSSGGSDSSNNNLPSSNTGLVNDSKPGTDNGGSFNRGDALSNVTGKWYASSDGTGNSGSVTTGGADSWTIDKVNEGSKYPYHIIGYKNGKFAGSGWVKKNQLAYKNGAKRIDEDQVAWTQEDGTEYIIRPSDGAILTPLAQGDSVLTSEASKNLWNMANNPMEFIRDNLTVSLPNVTTNSSGGSVENNIHMSLSLPGVSNYQEFVTQLQSDKKFEKMIVDVTSSALTGSNSLSKYRHKF